MNDAAKACGATLHGLAQRSTGEEERPMTGSSSKIPVRHELLSPDTLSGGAAAAAAEQFRIPGERRSKPRSANESKYEQFHSPAVTHAATPLFLSLAAAALAAGWLLRDEDFYTAKEGLGYCLGIGGSVCILLLLLYPMRKNLRFMRSWGTVKYYFRLHMILGVAGPVLILFHANFRLHAVNSNVALFSMLLVAASGLFGRFIYTKIHHGLYGRRLCLKELQSLCGISRAEIEHERDISPLVQRHLEQFEAEELARSRGLVLQLWRLLPLWRRAYRVRHQAIHDLEQDLKRQAIEERWPRGELARRLRHDRDLIGLYVRAVCRTAEFSMYERIFSMWHVVHVPLFFMMVTTAAVHVVAVHLY